MRTIKATWKTKGNRSNWPRTGQCPIGKKVCLETKPTGGVYECPHLDSRQLYPGYFAKVKCNCPNSVDFIMSKD